MNPLNKALKPNILMVIILISINAMGQTPAQLEQLFKEAEDGVDYVMRLFEEVDVVILGERDHRDTTQYEFVRRLISDPRFVESVGNIYTEVGTANTAELCAKTVTSDYNDYAEFLDSALSLIRQEDFYPLWSCTNRLQLLSNIYQINSHLPQSKRISLRGTDLAFDWNDCTTVEQYRDFIEKEVDGGKRDSLMAKTFLKQYDAQPLRDSRHKALYILNAPHAMKSPKIKRAGYYIHQALGENMATVVLNWTEWWRKDELSFRPWMDGYVDSAYIASNRIDCGFDLKGSALEDAEYWQDSASNQADGMVYYLTPKDFVLLYGIPGVIDDSFEEEILRRQSLYNEAKSYGENESLEMIMDFYNNIHIVSPNPYAEYKPGELPNGVKMPLEQALESFIKALSNVEKSTLALFDFEDDETYRGVKLLSYEIKETYASGTGVRISCELQFQDGSIVNRTICLRENGIGNYFYDGGL